MNNSFVSPIENLRIWNGGNWIKLDLKSILFLRIHYDQLLITSEDKVIESLNLNKKVKGIYKDDILILITNADDKEVRKIKFQIRENSLKIIQALQARFPVINYGSVVKICKVTTKYDNLENIFKSALEDKVKLDLLAMPQNYKSFVKLCLLDPMFPQIVQQTNLILEREILNSNNSSA